VAVNLLSIKENKGFDAENTVVLKVPVVRGINS
jgi:hypothetical protein